jgi:hypothetical protein
MAGRPRLSQHEREVRDNRILNLFLSGATEREIALARGVDLSPSRVHRVIVEQLEIAGERFGLISEKALIVYSERLEMLIKAIWGKAIGDKDPKAIEVARRLLDQQAKLYQISDENRGMPTAPMGDNDLAEDVADLVKYRERHRKPADSDPLAAN